MQFLSRALALAAAVPALAGAAAVPSERSTELEARNSYKGIGCDDIFVNMDDFDSANDLMQKGCNGQTTSYSVWSGNMVAFFCVWNPGPVCSVDAYNHMVQMVQDECPVDYGNTPLTAQQWGAGSYTNWITSEGNYSYGFTDFTKHSFCNAPAGVDPSTGGPLQAQI